MTTRASSCGCSGTNGAGPGTGMTGRVNAPLPPRRNFWPDHSLAPRTDFINERNRTALMWRL